MKNMYVEIQEMAAAGERINIETKFQGKQGQIENNLVKRVIAQDDEILSTVPVVNEEDSHFTFLEPIGRKERLIILGGGHIALPLCEFASKTGFYTIVADDRPSFANSVRFPLANKVICNCFENALEEIGIKDSDFIVIITRGHRHDALCLRNILGKSNPYYLGLIGSKRRVKGLFNMLEEEGYSRERMNEICTPIGLDIGAILPEEIAVSILAELISYRRKSNMVSTDLDFDVITHLAQDNTPKAVITVMKTKGSTPRRAGAKMTVNPFGKITGSIGGGCAESSVIHEAVHMIGTGQYKVVEIDMTGDVAESEGMVCGGIMEVLIEDDAR